jgi:hypothetical protein
MTTNQDTLWFRLFFKLRLYEARGENFQRFISELIYMKDPRFQSVCPYGNQGDGGNDGYIQEDEHYFQVYGPLASSQSVAQSATKAREDFDKLKENYPSIKKYTFVMNDRYEGIPTAVTNEIDQIKRDHSIEATCVGSIQLEKIFTELPQEDKVRFVQCVPPEEDCWVDTSEVGRMLTNIAVKQLPQPVLKLEAPDVDKKIKVNDFSEIVSHQITYHLHYRQAVEDYFVSFPALRQEVGEKINSMYTKTKENIYECIPAHEPNRSDFVYQKIKSQIMPAYESAVLQKVYDQALNIILSYYFETCDIGEYTNDPSA